MVSVDPKVAGSLNLKAHESASRVEGCQPRPQDVGQKTNPMKDWAKPPLPRPRPRPSFFGASLAIPQGQVR